jgi:hypothetical protein
MNFLVVAHLDEAQAASRSPLSTNFIAAEDSFPILLAQSHQIAMLIFLCSEQNCIL